MAEEALPAVRRVQSFLANDYLAAQRQALGIAEVPDGRDYFQALAYQSGELLIRALRQEAEKILRDSFDLRTFHDHLLDEGAPHSPAVQHL